MNLRNQTKEIVAHTIPQVNLRTTIVNKRNASSCIYIQNRRLTSITSLVSGFNNDLQKIMKWPFHSLICSQLSWYQMNLTKVDNFLLTSRPLQSSRVEWLWRTKDIKVIFNQVPALFFYGTSYNFMIYAMCYSARLRFYNFITFTISRQQSQNRLVKVS